MIFIKGKIKHADHKTQHFFDWHRVYRNTEIENRDRSAIQGWVD